ncbi:TIR domain-containing protein [Lentzea alba]
MEYDAFISYNREADRFTAPLLQRLIRRVGKSWRTPSSLRIFRDTTNLRLSPSLEHALIEALKKCDSFILMASPQAAVSPWVRFEVDWWRNNRSQDKFFIVHSGGRILWNKALNDFDSNTDALPEEVRGWYSSEPIWASIAGDGKVRRPKLRDAALTIAAHLYGMEKDQLRDEDRLALRKTRRNWGIAGSLLVIAVAGAVFAGTLAVESRVEAGTQQQIGLSRKLAGASESQLATNLDVANLLAAKAFRTDPNPQTRAALFRAVSASGNMTRYLPFDADVSKLAASADGSAVVAGLKDGRVMRWRLTDRTPEQVLDLDTEIVSVAISGNGDVVAAADKSSARVARKGREPESVTAVRDAEFRAVAVSESGRTAVVTSDKNGAVAAVLTDGASQVDHRLDRTIGYDHVVTSDDEVLFFDSGYGQWARVRVSDWRAVLGADTGFGTANYGQAVSADGRAFSYTNGGDTIWVWQTDRDTSVAEPHLNARAPIAKPGAMALSADASHLAIAEDGAIYVSQVLAPGSTFAEPVKLNGTGRVTYGGLVFLGKDDRKLASASGNRVTLWDLDQVDRIGRSFPIELSPGCNACGPPDVALSHDGAQMMAFDGSGWAGVIGPVARPGEIRQLADLNLDALYGPALWRGSEAVVVVQPQVGGSRVKVPAGFPSQVRAVAAGQRNGEVIAAAMGSERLVVVQSDGGFDLVDVASGDTRTVVPDPSAPVAPKAPDVSAAAASSSLVAVADKASVVVRDASTGAEVGRLAQAGVRYLAFVGDRLLVQLESGELEVWDDRLTGRRNTIAGDAGLFWPPSSNGVLVARARGDNSVTVADLESGSVVLTVPGDPESRVGIGFSGDGKWMLTVAESRDSGPATAVVRDISDENLVRTACTTAGRDLTADEWRALVDASAPDDLRCR